MTISINFMKKCVEGHAEKQKKFIESRTRKKTLRAYKDYSEERKQRFDAYTDFVKCNHFYMIMFLEYLKDNVMIFTNHRDEYNERLKEKGHNVLELYENCECEQHYIEMCDIIKNDINTANLICKYNKKDR